MAETNTKLVASVIAALAAGSGVTITMNETDLVKSEDHKAVVAKLETLKAAADVACPALISGRIKLEAAIASVPGRRRPPLTEINDGLLSTAQTSLCNLAGEPDV